MARRFVFNPIESTFDIVGTSQQNFTATAGQTIFTVSLFNINDECVWFANYAEVDKTLYTRSGNIVTFTTGFDAGTRLTCIN